MATVKLTHIEKVRNQLRFYREDGKFYYWDFSAKPCWENEGQCWYGLKGKPLSKAPSGAIKLMLDTYANLEWSCVLNAEQRKLMKYIQLVLFMRGQDHGDSCANWDYNPTRYLGSSWATLFMACFESFINMGLDIDIIYAEKYSRNLAKVGRKFKYIVDHYLDGNNDTSTIVKAFHKFYKELREKNPNIPIRLDMIEQCFQEADYLPLKNLGFTNEQINKYRSYNISFKKMQKYHQFILNCHKQLDLSDFLCNLYSISKRTIFCRIVETVVSYLNKCDKMGYSPRKNCDVSKELKHIDEQYRLWCAQADSKKLKDLNLEQYMFEDDNYTIVLPQSAQDLIDCGNALNNCVGRYGYWKKMVDEHSCIIVFVKKKNDLDKHYVCCEIVKDYNDGLKINQFYTTNNDTPCEEALIFRKRYEDFLMTISKENVKLNYK